jgi:hypothetical protein
MIRVLMGWELRLIGMRMAFEGKGKRFVLIPGWLNIGGMKRLLMIDI